MTITPIVTDPDNNTVELSVENAPNQSTFGEGVFNWKPSYDLSKMSKDMVEKLSKRFNEGIL